MWWCQSRYGNQSIGLIDNWIRHIKDVYRLHEHYLNTFEDEEERFNKFVEVNAQEQVFDFKTSIVQNAWRNGQDLTLHGWTYGLNSGYVTDLGEHGIKFRVRRSVQTKIL
jgi:carbonic anhydrase